MLATKVDQLQNEFDKALKSNKKSDIHGVPLALKNIVEENHTFYSFSKEINVTREALYHALSKHGNPKLSTLLSILKALNLKIKIEPQK